MFSAPLTSASTLVAIGLLHGFGVRAGVVDFDFHRRGRDLRILRDRKGENAEAARDQDDQGDDNREDGPVDEEFRHGYSPSSPERFLGGQRLFGGIHGVAGPDLLKAFHDDPLAGS